MTDPCGKVRYLTKSDAKLGARRARGDGNHRTFPYRCPDCGYWHLSSVDAKTREAFRARDRSEREGT